MDITTKASKPQQIALYLAVLQPIINSQLCQSDRANCIDAEGLVLAYSSIRIVLGQRRNPWEVPKGAGRRFIDSGAIDHNVNTAKDLESRFPQRVDRGPVTYVCFVVNTRWSAIFCRVGISRKCLLSFFTKAYIRCNYRGTCFKKLGSEYVVDAWVPGKSFVQIQRILSHGKDYMGDALTRSCTGDDGDLSFELVPGHLALATRDLEL